MSFIINNKLSFVDSFPFPSSSLNSLVKKLSKHDFKNLSQEFVNNVLDLIKQKGFYPYEYINDFEKFKEKFRCKEKIYSFLTGRKASGATKGRIFFSNRYSKTNNKYLKSFDREQESKLVI